MGKEGQTLVKRFNGGHFPGGPVVKNPPSNAGDGGLIPGQGTKILHAVGQLSPRPLEPAHCTEIPCVPQGRSRVPQLRPDAAK